MTLKATLYIVHCTLYIVHCTLYIVHCITSNILVHIFNILLPPTKTCIEHIIGCYMQLQPAPDISGLAIHIIKWHDRWWRYCIAGNFHTRNISHTWPQITSPDGSPYKITRIRRPLCQRDWGLWWPTCTQMYSVRCIAHEQCSYMHADLQRRLRIKGADYTIVISPIFLLSLCIQFISWPLCWLSTVHITCIVHMWLWYCSQSIT